MVKQKQDTRRGDRHKNKGSRQRRTQHISGGHKPGSRKGSWATYGKVRLDAHKLSQRCQPEHSQDLTAPSGGPQTGLKSGTTESVQESKPSCLTSPEAGGVQGSELSCLTSLQAGGVEGSTITPVVKRRRRVATVPMPPISWGSWGSVVL